MAGSNAVSRGVPRRIQQGPGPSVPIIGAGQIPTIQFSTGNARALQQFSRDLFSLSNQFEDQLDDQAAAEASSQGAIAGASGDFELQSYGTIRGRNFNKAAIETFASTLDTQSMGKLAELKDKFYGDPAGLRAAWDNYTKGIAGELSKTSPEQAAAFANRSAVRGLPAFEQAKDTAFALTRSEADAALIENEAALRSEIKTHASDLFSQNPDRSRTAMNAIGMVQQDFMKIYTARDPLTNKPLYTPEEIAKAKKQFSDMTFSSAAISWFDAQEDKAGAYMKFVNGDFKFNVAANNDQVQIKMANAGSVRNLPLKQELQDQVRAAAAATGEGLSVVVHSGGQTSSRDPRRRGVRGGGGWTGSHRHDDGGAGDMKLARDGQILDFNQNRELYIKFAENAAAAGITGIGVDEAKGYLHLGGGSTASWGYRGNRNGSEFLPGDFGAAINRGRATPMDTKPSKREVPLSDMLSPRALDGLDSEMRSRISFANTLKDREDKLIEDVIKAGQEKNAFDFSSRLYGAGATDPATGQTLVAPSREEVIAATRSGRLKASDGEAIIKAMATERPARSDEATLRDLTARVFAGEDVYSAVMAAGNKLSTDDVKELLTKNQSLNKDEGGGLKGDKKFYFDRLQERLRGGAGPLADIDEGRAARSVQAMDEYYKRVNDPENVDPPDVIMNDIATRAASVTLQFNRDKLGGFVPPRYSIMLPDRRLDIQGSARALMSARQAGSITEAQFQIEQKRLIDWKKLQDEVDRDAAAAGTKKK